MPGSRCPSRRGRGGRRTALRRRGSLGRRLGLGLGRRATGHVPGRDRAARSLIEGRTDVRIDWNGQRGRPRDDARVVFTGTAGAGDLRVRFRSATQLEEFTRIISLTALLTDRHAIWYPSEQMITARLDGDYDQFHAVVAQALVSRLKKRPICPGQPPRQGCGRGAGQCRRISSQRSSGSVMSSFPHHTIGVG
jgi:hypothetical protein